jgi:hypothetical protein
MSGTRVAGLEGEKAVRVFTTDGRSGLETWCGSRCPFVQALKHSTEIKIATGY